MADMKDVVIDAVKEKILNYALPLIVGGVIVAVAAALLKR